MTEQEIRALIEKNISYYRKVFRLLKDSHSAGALEALYCLLDEIEESEEQ